MRKGIANTSHIAKPVSYIGIRTVPVFTGFTPMLSGLITVAITLLSFSSLAQKADNTFTVVIDAGHGGKDPGTRGAYTKEKDIALKVTLKLGEIIEENMKDVKVLYTRKKDVFIDLDKRSKFANDNHADVFIVIHVNSLPESTPEQRKQSIMGTETYVLGLHKTEANFEVARRENSVIFLEENYQEKYEGFDPNSPESYLMLTLSQSANLESSLLLAAKIESQLKTKGGRKSKGVKQAGFQVLWQTTMPGVYCEIGYLSNTKEEKELNDPKVQENIASAIYRALKEYKAQMESIN
ncbi:MAG TPA: N-acetylmuramoyl-L-alanine amidase [Cyclobacteriaceae bacterium]|nr:N-acetylmuramoyl-L-alanine amidase [Cyclobacteriaceae bacterium]